MNEQIRILVLSDIHTTDQDPNAHDSPSYVSTQNGGAKGGIDPFQGMIDCVRDFVGSVNFVICPGDMTDQAQPAGLVYVATQLRRAAAELKAQQLVVVAGNHDVDSRFTHNHFDPRGHLMSTFPDMPFEAENCHLEFFAYHVALHAVKDIRFLAVDSAAFHGGGPVKRKDGSVEIPEYAHGRVSPLMLRRIESLLQADSGAYRLNVLVCHHHPQNNNVAHELDFSQMEGGPALLELLGGRFGRWLVIHGHKHRPRLTYAAGTATSPVILGAASFSAQIGGDALNRSPNQFHLMTIKPDLAQQLGCGIAGSVDSWSWIVGDGWRPAAPAGHGLPGKAGFGFRGDPDALADQIARSFSGPGSKDWATAISEFPALTALLPRDFDALRARLEQAGINILDVRGIPKQIGRS